MTILTAPEQPLIMPSKNTTRSRRAVLDSDDDMGRSAETTLCDTEDMYEPDEDNGFAPDVEDVAEIDGEDDEDDSTEDWEGNADQATLNDIDWEEIVACSNQRKQFLPPFLDRTARLDKNYLLSSRSRKTTLRNPELPDYRHFGLPLLQKVDI